MRDASRTESACPVLVYAPWTHEQFARLVNIVGGSLTVAQMSETMQSHDAEHFREWIEGTCCDGAA